MIGLLIRQIDVNDCEHVIDQSLRYAKDVPLTGDPCRQRNLNAWIIGACLSGSTNGLSDTRPTMAASFDPRRASNSSLFPGITNPVRSRHQNREIDRLAEVVQSYGGEFLIGGKNADSYEGEFVERYGTMMELNRKASSPTAA